MRLDDARKLAADLIAEHLDGTWTFEWSNARKRLGQCDQDNRTIRLSAPNTRRGTPERVRNTVLHEIAHALVGPGHGHDNEWRATALAIGCDGKRCADVPDEQRPPYRWVAECDRCGAEHGAYRMGPAMREGRVRCAAHPACRHAGPLRFTRNHDRGKVRA